MRHFVSLAACAAVLVCSATVRAQNIIMLTGAATQISPPSDVSEGVRESNTQAFVFAEQQDVTLLSRLRVDVNMPGTYANDSDLPSPSPFLRRNSVVSSFYLYTDSIGRPSTYTGSITFDQNIVGVIERDGRLNDTDVLLGLAPTTTYSPGGRAPELNPDSFTISTDSRTLDFSFHTGSARDTLRIIVAAPAAVPEPGSVAVLVAMASVGVGVLRKRRK